MALCLVLEGSTCPTLRPARHRSTTKNTSINERSSHLAAPLFLTHTIERDYAASFRPFGCHLIDVHVYIQEAWCGYA